MKKFSAPVLAFIAVMLCGADVYSQDCIGWWKFDDSLSVLRAETGYGSDLASVGAYSVVEGPAAGDGAVRIPMGSSLRLQHGIAANGGGNLVNAYTLQFDFRVRDRSVWHCFYQTDTTNASDGEFFINPSGSIGVGMTGYTSWTISAGEWYRLVVTVELGSFFRWYVDGQLAREGGAQSIDNRFALAPLLLLFSDENGEDGEIDIAEIRIWDRALTAEEAASLGGFGHRLPGGKIVDFNPYLQAPTSSSITISWHDSSTAVPYIEYGVTPSLGEWKEGSGEDIDVRHRWQTVRLTGLQADMEYYYRCVSGSGASPVYRFRSAPDSNYSGHLRFLIFGDSQSDTARFAATVRKAKATVERLYGSDVHNQLHLIAHVGDIMGDGSVVSAYLDEYFRPLSPLSSSVPAMISIGNHEGDNPAFYSYMRYEEFSPFRKSAAAAERFYSFNLTNTHFVFLNSHPGSPYTATQTAWLASDLARIDADPAVDFTFVFTHRPGRSEIWPDGNTSFVQNDIMSILRNAAKVQQLAYGHTHAYERGVVESASPAAQGDFRLLLCGGVGGALDRWGMYRNQTDYPEIHTAYDHHHFTIIDVDVAEQSYTGTMYSLGNSDGPLDAAVLDTWHRKLRQPAPDKPSALAAVSDTLDVVHLTLSDFSGADSVMSAQFQITRNPGDYAAPLVDTVRHWQNIYDVDAQFRPVDRSANIDLARLSRPLERGEGFAWRGRYRDHNLRWSAWSDEQLFTLTAIGAPVADARAFEIGAAYPNPAAASCAFPFALAREMDVDVAVHDALGRRVRTLCGGRLARGVRAVVWDGRDAEGAAVPNGVYYCRAVAEGHIAMKVVIVSR